MANIIVKNNLNEFGNTGGSGNTTSYSNSEIFLVSNNSISANINSVQNASFTTSANTPYPTLSLREGTYGFPKNPQGNIKDSIYSLLDFQNFTIGTISGLSGIDPGRDYNIDPFVLPIQPFISSFDRRDYIIEIENQTNDFLNGERINQSTANLVFFDLQVSSGVFGNNFSQKFAIINSHIDIDSDNDFIYTSIGNDQTFNPNTDIIESENFILLSNNPYQTGDAIRYTTSSGNTEISGLSNNDIYFVVSSNSSGIRISEVSGGVELNISASTIIEEGHNLRRYSNSFANGELIVYRSSDSDISGLVNNDIYFIVGSNNFGFSLSSTENGSPVNLTADSTENDGHFISTVPGYLPGDRVFSDTIENINPSTDIDFTNNFILLESNPFDIGSEITYTTSSGNTEISGLSNNDIYFVVSSNSSGIKLSSNLNGPAIDLISGGDESGHSLFSRANGEIQSVFSIDSNQFVRLRNIENNFSNGNILKSYTSSIANGEIQNIEFSSIVSTARGKVKPGSNNTHLKVERTSFENTFREGSDIIGDVSGSVATIVSIEEDESSRPIGLNANISANVTTASGQITNLQVVDSGFGYVNNEIVEFTSENGIRAGSSRVILNGPGVGRGFYKSSRGFLSSDMRVQDGDFYQEYSYEVLTKISFNRYFDMFKNVMHTAGTKFFGSILSVEEADVSADILDSSRVFDLSFNASSDVDNTENTININKSNTFVNGDIVQYRVNDGNTALSPLVNNGKYEIINTEGSTIQLSNNGVLDLSPGSFEIGHRLLKIESNN